MKKRVKTQLMWNNPKLYDKKGDIRESDIIIERYGRRSIEDDSSRAFATQERGVVPDVVPSVDHSAVLERVADAVRSQGRPALWAPQESRQGVSAVEEERRGERLFGEQGLDGFPEVLRNDWIVLAHVVPDLPDVHRVVDDGLDRHAAKSISRLGFLVLSIQLIGDPLQLGRWRTCEKSSEPVRPRSG